MKFISLLYMLLISSTLYAQKSLQEIRVEENLFIMKIIGVVVLLLVAMPFVLRKLKTKAPVQEHMPHVPREAQPVEEKEIPVQKDEEAEPAEMVDPVDRALEDLFNEHNVPSEKREDFAPLYRRYLELKMGKVSIKMGSFDFNTALDVLMTRLHRLDEHHNFEIVFDIDAKVPKQIIGDVERMEDVLFFVLKQIVMKSSRYLIEIHIKRLELGDDALHLEISVPYANDNYKQEKSEVFTPFKEGVTETGLELYLAKAYARLMHGEVIFEQSDWNDSMLVVSLKLYMPNPSEMRHYRLPSKTMIGHSVLVVDDHHESAMAVQKMFEYFKNEVDALSSKELFFALEMLEDYDIVVIQERYFSKNLIAKLEAIKSKRVIKAVSLNKNEVFEHTNSETIALLDGEVSKPVTIQKVFDLLISLYQEK